MINGDVMKEKEYRNNIYDLSQKLNQLHKANEELKSLFYFKQAQVDIIKHSFSEYVGKLMNMPTSKLYSEVKFSALHIPFNNRSYSENTVKEVYSLLKYEEEENDVKRIYDDCYNKVESSLDEVKPLLKGNLGWVFTGRKNKDRALSAADYLLGLYNNSYIGKIDALKSRYNLIDLSLSTSHFKGNQPLYAHKLNELVGCEVYSEYDPEKPDFDSLQALERDLKRVNTGLNKILAQTNDLKDSVIKNASLMQQDESVQFLKQIPIEEINREKLGIKVNALKNAGINTVYDAYKASVWEISGIYGVSEDSAYTIKNKVNQMQANALKTVKIRLNSDNKTVAGTNLISSLYNYILNKDVLKEVENLNNACFSHIGLVIEVTSKFDNNTKWYNASLEEKGIVDKSYKIFKSVRNSDYFTKAIELIRNTIIEKGRISNSALWDHFEKNSARYYSELDELCPGLVGNGDTFYGLPEDLVKEIQDECIFPDGLLVTLRRYQEWGVKYILHQKRVLLGDEMGLGKTIQAIATMVSLRNTGAKHFIVVCPASVIINWCREIQTHSKLKAIKVHGQGRKMAIKQWIKNGGVAVTTYETTGVFDLPDDFRYDMITVDEAHYCKNPEAIRTKNVRALSSHTDRILYMTGTALENKVDEMIELISHLQPELARVIKNYSFMSAHEQFKERVAPVYYRRKRADVLTELPDLIINKEWCSLTREEKEVYEDTVLNGSYQSVRRVSWNINDLDKSSKMNRLKEIIEESKSEGRKVIVFSYFLETIRKIGMSLGSICSQPITGSINPRRRQEIIDDFNDSPAGSVLLAQIQAGGTGLNIQAASVVVIAEPQFKPSIENQAISRAYRMGQTRNVLVFRLLCENTVDEKLMDVLEEKQMIFDAFADESVAAMANKEIDEKTFGDIIKEEIERIKAEKGIE